MTWLNFALQFRAGETLYHDHISKTVVLGQHVYIYMNAVDLRESVEKMRYEQSFFLFMSVFTRTHKKTNQD